MLSYAVQWRVENRSFMRRCLSGGSTSRRGDVFSSSGSPTGSSSLDGWNASDRFRRRRGTWEAVDKERLAEVVTRPSPAASTAAAVAVPLYPPSDASRPAGATLSAAPSPVSECRPAGRPPTYTKPTWDRFLGPALVATAAAADARRGCSTDEQGKAAAQSVVPAAHDVRRDHYDGGGGGKAMVAPSKADDRPAERHGDGDDGNDVRRLQRRSPSHL